MQKYISNFTTVIFVVLGVALGLCGAEVALRKLPLPIAQTLGAYRVPTPFRLPAPAFWQVGDPQTQGWFVFGGQQAAGQNLREEKWFGRVYGQTAGVKFYNMAFAGALSGQGMLEEAQNQLKNAGVTVQKAVVVVDMSLPAQSLLRQNNPVYGGWQGVLAHSALLRLLGYGPPPTPYKQAEIMAIAQRLAAFLEPYALRDESAIVLLVPAKEYWGEDAVGTIHRQNQEKLGLALRALGKVYVVDVSYMMRALGADPMRFYASGGTLLTAEGHKALAEGLRRQLAVFSDWRAVDELTLEERQKLEKDVEAYYAKEAERKQKLPF